MGLPPWLENILAVLILVGLIFAPDLLEPLFR